MFGARALRPGSPEGGCVVGEVVGACGASLGGPYAAAKAHCCVAADVSRSSLAARCVSFYQTVCLSLSLSLSIYS